MHKKNSFIAEPRGYVWVVLRRSSICRSVDSCSIIEGGSIDFSGSKIGSTTFNWLANIGSNLVKN